MYVQLTFCLLTAATVSFNESSYVINEASGLVQPVLILSNPSSSDVVIQVGERGQTAVSKPASL